MLRKEITYIYQSKCCEKPSEVVGNVTKHYTCTGCGKPCDAELKRMPTESKRIIKN